MISTGPVKSKRIAALVPNILGHSPGQRVRIELWANALKSVGWEIEFLPFEDELLHEILYTEGNSVRKAGGIIRCYEKQLRVVLRRISADVIFIFREASLIGPAVLERLAARQKIPIIFDVDDPIFLPYKSPTNNWASLLKFSRKTHKIFRLSTHVIAINNLIGDYAAKFNPNVTVIPNCVDTDKFVPRGERQDSMGGPTKLVWIGSRSTMQNLREIEIPIRKLQSKNNTPLIVIGAGEADLDLEQLETRQWSAETEVADLQEGDIGLLPLNDLPWNDWKFFFKAIQYMAVGIPVVAQRTGSTSELIQNGLNGFLVETPDEWHSRLEYLTLQPEIRKQMGKAARQTAVESYSLKTQIPRILDLFERVGNTATENSNGRH